MSKISESLSFGKDWERIRKIPTPNTEFQSPTSKYLVVVFTWSLLFFALFVPRLQLFPACFKHSNTLFIFMGDACVVVTLVKKP